MAIKKIKIATIFVNEEKEITSKKDSKKYILSEVNVKTAEDSKEYAGKYIKLTFFAYNDPKDSSKNKTATEKAEYFKTQNLDKEILLDITEQEYEKEGEKKISLVGKLLTKAQREVAEQFVK